MRKIFIRLFSILAAVMLLTVASVVLATEISSVVFWDEDKYSACLELGKEVAALQNKYGAVDSSDLIMAITGELQFYFSSNDSRGPRIWAYAEPDLHWDFYIPTWSYPEACRVLWLCTDIVTDNIVAYAVATYSNGIFVDVESYTLPAIIAVEQRTMVEDDSGAQYDISSLLDDALSASDVELGGVNNES